HLGPVRHGDGGPIHAAVFQEAVVSRKGRGEDFEVRHRVIRGFARAGFGAASGAWNHSEFGEGPGDRNRTSESPDLNRVPRGSTGSACSVKVSEGMQLSGVISNSFISLPLISARQP